MHCPWYVVPADHTWYMTYIVSQMILDTLIATRGNSAKAAQTLGITERIMGLRIQKYQIDVQNYKHLSDDDNN